MFYISQECLKSILGRRGPIFVRSHLFTPDPGACMVSISYPTSRKDFFTIGDWNTEVTVQDIYVALEWYQSDPEIKTALMESRQDTEGMYMDDFGMWHMRWCTINGKLQVWDGLHLCTLH